MLYTVRIHLTGCGVVSRLLSCQLAALGMFSDGLGHLVVKFPNFFYPVHWYEH